MLLKGLSEFAEGMEACITRPMGDDVYVAFLDLSYNIGLGAFCKASVARLYIAGERRASCRAILARNKAGGRVVPGPVYLTNDAHFQHQSQPRHHRGPIAAGRTRGPATCLDYGARAGPGLWLDDGKNRDGDHGRDGEGRDPHRFGVIPEGEAADLTRLKAMDGGQQDDESQLRMEPAVGKPGARDGNADAERPNTQHGRCRDRSVPSSQTRHQGRDPVGRCVSSNEDQIICEDSASEQQCARDV